MTLEQARQRNALADALEKAARLADTVYAGGWDIPPRHIASECRYWADAYRVKLKAASPVMQGNNREGGEP